MLAKTAKQIVEEHLGENKISKTSKVILSDVALKAKEAGLQGPFSVRKVAVLTPEIEEFKGEAKSEEDQEVTAE